MNNYAKINGTEGNGQALGYHYPDTEDMNKNKTLDDIRESTEDISKISGPVVDGGGWHFSYFGGEEMIKHKITSFSHTEHNNKKILSSISDNVENNVDLFGRNVYFKVISIEDSEYPQYILDHQEKLSHLIK